MKYNIFNPEEYADNIASNYYIQEPSLLEKIQRQEGLASDILYKVPFSTIPNQPGQFNRYIPTYEKLIDYPDVPLELLPSRRNKITGKNKKRPRNIKSTKYIRKRKII